MKTLIAGAGRFGTQAAQVFAVAGDEVTLVDLDDDRLAALADSFPARLLPGDACDPGILEQAGVYGCELLIAATGDDEDNLVISLLAKRQFGVPRVAARYNDPDNAWLFDQHWGVDVAVPASTPLISLIQEAAGTTDTVALLRLTKAGVTVIETAIGPHSRTAGRPLSDIVLPPGAMVATVIRNGEPLAPGADVLLQPGDELLIVSHTTDTGEVQAAFQ